MSDENRIHHVIDVLLSVVLLVRNGEHEIESVIVDLQSILARSTTDYEIVVVDNRSIDQTVPILEKLSTTIPNLQVYCLSAQVSDDIARIAGIQQAIGDYVILLDLYDDISLVPALLERSLDGHDLVVAVRSDAREQREGRILNLAARMFMVVYRFISGYDLDVDAPRYRLMSRRLVNFILQHEDAHLTYLLLPMSGGFKSDRLLYSPSNPRPHRMARNFRDAVRYAVSLILFTSAIPLRLVSITCGTAAILSLLYSIYVCLVFLFQPDVVKGWTTLSLQISVQFFLLAVAIGLLAEYMVHMMRNSTKRPHYFISREFRSGQMTREIRLNIRREQIANH